MRHLRLLAAGLVAVSLIGFSSGVSAQGGAGTRPAPVESPDPPAPRSAPRAGAGAAAGASAGAAQDPEISWENRGQRYGQVVRIGDREVFVTGRPTLRVWQDFALRQGDAVRDVVVVYGATTIDGVVTRDVVSVFGSVTLGPTAVLNGSLVVVAGNTTIAPGARIRQDLVMVGGDLNAPGDFFPGGEHVHIGTSLLGDRLRAFVPWLTGGLLLGRPVVPSVPWVWPVMGIFLIVSLLINLLMHRHVGLCADRLATRPFSTFLTGLLVLLLLGPASALLAISVVGIVVLPFLVCALLIAWMTGKVGVARALGRAVFGTVEEETRPQGLRAVVVGFVAIMLVYTVPFLGLIAWALVGVFGLGAAVQAFAGGLRRERARPAPVSPPPASGPGDGSSGPSGGPSSDLLDRGPSPAASPLTSPATFASSPIAAPAQFAGPETYAESPVATGSFDAAATMGAGAAAAAMPAGPTMDADALGLSRPSEERARALLAFPRARFMPRFAALVIDVVLVFFANGVFEIVRPWDNRGLLLLFLIYFVGGWAWKGTTIGGIICNLRVAKTNGKPLEFADALGRGIAGVVSLLALGLGLLWVLIEPERQGWHDKLTDTCVVLVPRTWPI